MNESNPLLDHIREVYTHEVYAQRVAQFRKALSTGDRIEARRLARLFDWPEEEVIELLIEWFNEQSVSG